MFDEEDLIFSYTRAQAIEDGVLVDVSIAARDVGIKYPVALTRAVFGQYVEVQKGVKYQDERGRLWDLLWMLLVAIRQSKEQADHTIYYQVYVRNDNREPTPVTLKAVCEPDDDGKPCITVMLPDED